MSHVITQQRRAPVLARSIAWALAATIAATLLGGCSGTGASPAVTPAPTETTAPSDERVVFAVIGDHGVNNDNARAVADLVASWEPSYVIALGDCYYTEAGDDGAGKYDTSTGQYYGAWIAGAMPPAEDAPPGQAAENAFFPIMGNHDYDDAKPSPDTYLDYFTLPGAGIENSSDNERYYDFVRGQIHFFALNSAPEEPDGIVSDSPQATWLKERLAASDSLYKVVFVHRPPYSSDLNHGTNETLQWPFAEWGADVVLSGHAHTYERVDRDGIVYFVNGLGGANRYRFKPVPTEGSVVRFRDDWGAQKVTVSGEDLVFEFYAVDGTLVDSYRLAP